MANIDQAFPSTYLKAADLNGRTWTLAIKTVHFEDIGDSDRKLVCYFEKTEKGLVLNKTNAYAIGAAYGKDTDMWVGKQVEVYPDQTMFQGRPTACIRVRPKYPAADGAPGAGMYAPGMVQADQPGTYSASNPNIAPDLDDSVPF